MPTHASSDGAGFDRQALITALSKLRSGDFTVRLPETGDLADIEIASLFNDVVSLNQQIADECERLSQAELEDGKARQNHSRTEQALKEENFNAQLENLRIARELHESRVRHQALLNTLPIAVYEAETLPDGTLRRRFAGGDLTRLVGSLATALETGSVAWEEFIVPADRSRLLIGEEQDEMSSEYRWTGDGSQRHFIDKAVRDRKDNPRRWVGTLIEITERKQLEAQLLQAGKLDALGQLTGGVAHDFNNLLAAVLGGLSVLEKRVTFEEREHSIIVQMRHAAENGVELVRQMMAFARKQELRPVSIAPEDLCQSVSGLVRHTLGGTIELKWSCQSEDRHFFVDQPQLELVIVNLILNARDAMPDGGLVEITVQEMNAAEIGAKRLGDGDFLRIRVADTGIGIPEDIIDRVVEPFFTTKGVGHGTGLGLSMASGFALQSGGKLEIRRRRGPGTIVEIYLPCAPREEALAPEAADPARADLPANCSALIVDDDDAVRLMLCEQLKEIGRAHV